MNLPSNSKKVLTLERLSLEAKYRWQSICSAEKRSALFTSRDRENDCMLQCNENTEMIPLRSRMRYAQRYVRLSWMQYSDPIPPFVF